MPAAIAITFFNAAPEFHADRIVIRIEPQSRTRECGLNLERQCGVRDEITTAAGSPCAISTAKVGPERTATRGGKLGAENLLDNLRHAEQGPVLDPLRGADETHCRVSVLGQPAV